MEKGFNTDNVMASNCKFAPSKITPCLWFAGNAEEAANFYVSVFANAPSSASSSPSCVTHVARYTKAGQEVHSMQPGSVLTVDFSMAGQRFTALNGPPLFKFSEAVSLQVFCADQAEIDYFWSKFTEGGGQEGECGWLKDKFGFSWQIVPNAMMDMMRAGQPDQLERVTASFMKMKKCDLAVLQRAFDGQ